MDIRGNSIVFGNAELEDALSIGQEIVRRFGPEGLEVFAGASNNHQVGHETPASRALARALEKEKLTILALGPVTNIATLLKNHPELGRRIERIVAVAGRRRDQRFVAGKRQARPFRDFNFEMDPAGFQVLLDSQVPIVLTPWEISSKVRLDHADVKQLRAGTDATRYLFGPARDWLDMWRKDFGADGFNPFDTLAVAYATSPEWLTCRELPAAIEVLPDDRSTRTQHAAGIPTKPYLLVGDDVNSKRTVNYCFDISREFKPDLLRRLYRLQCEIMPLGRPRSIRSHCIPSSDQVLRERFVLPCPA